MTNEEQKRKLRNLKNVLTRRARYMPVPGEFRCEGGPYDGATLRLQDGSTFPFTVGDWSGRYNQVNDKGYWHTASYGATVVWEGDNATH